MCIDNRQVCVFHHHIEDIALSEDKHILHKMNHTRETRTDRETKLEGLKKSGIVT